MALLNVAPYDREYYETVIKPFLPRRFIDCHTHVWLDEFLTGGKRRSGGQSWPNLVAKDNSVEDLLETNRLLFPDNEVISVLYGDPILPMDLPRNNAYVAAHAERLGVPALYLSHPNQTPEELEQAVLSNPVFRGIKVYLQFAPAYIPDDEIRIYDFLPKEHLALCNKHGWVAQLHIARSGRLGDPVNYHQILEIEENYPDMQLILAHLGRAYADEDVGNALDYLRDMKKTMWDFTANTNEHVIRRVLEVYGSDHLMYGSDFPIFRMKARRVVENGVYINEVPKGEFPHEALAGDKHMREIDYPEAENITFFIYEEINACREACGRLGLGKEDVEKIFFSNAARVFGVKE